MTCASKVPSLRSVIGCGSAVEFSVNAGGEVVLHPHRPARKGVPRKDRFDAVRGRADVPWRTDELMKLLRAEV